jgi:molybdopterin synthase catalytic subunit
MTLPDRSDVHFDICAEAIDAGGLKERLGRAAAGACVCFEGWVRDHNEGEAVLRLEYETHAAIARTEGEKVLREALERFDVLGAWCVHRVGLLEIGDCAVWVGVSAAHRGAAFDACRYVIDEIKQRLPIWKKEHYASGESGWVNCAQPRTGRATATTAST